MASLPASYSYSEANLCEADKQAALKLNASMTLWYVRVLQNELTALFFEQKTSH